MTPFDRPTKLQLDALREVVNIGCGQAANAMSRLFRGQQVRIDVPRVAYTSAETMPAMLGGGHAQVVSALLKIEGELEGQMLLVLPVVDARALCTLLLGDAAPGRLSALERSALNEVANIVASASLSAIGDFTKMRLLPSTPTLSEDDVAAVATRVFAARGLEPGPVVVLETRFHTEGAPLIAGQMLVLPEGTSLRRLFERLGV